jgi:hypothetical protein
VVVDMFKAQRLFHQHKVRLCLLPFVNSSLGLACRLAAWDGKAFRFLTRHFYAMRLDLIAIVLDSLFETPRIQVDHRGDKSCFGQVFQVRRRFGPRLSFIWGGPCVRL